MHVNYRGIGIKAGNGQDVVLWPEIFALALFHMQHIKMALAKLINRLKYRKK